MRSELKPASTAHRGIGADISMIFDNAVMPQHGSRSKAGKSSNPGFGLNRCAGRNERAGADLNIG
jgi:hypothetical protein